MNRQREVESIKEKMGKIKWTHIPIDQAISWPLEETDLQEAILVGHRSMMEPFQYRAFLIGLGIKGDKLRELTAPSAADTNENRENAAKGGDVDISVDPPLGNRHKLTEVWVNMPYELDGEAVKMQVFIDETKKKLIWADYNYHLYQTTPYFDLPYWRETDTIFASGAGHESMYPQAADSAMWNMLIDNLKLMGNYLIGLKEGTGAEDLQDQIGPGYRLVTDDPQADMATHQLGGDLSHLAEAMELNDRRHMRSTDINALAQGFGDPVLKSGASPGTYQNLLARTNRKFRQVDKDIRAELSRVFSFMVELLQQYAGDGVFYKLVDEETAHLVRRIKFRPPTGNLRQMFRITIKPPSATANNEQLKMDLMMLYNLSVQHAQFVIQLAQSTWGDYDPGKLFRLMAEWLAFFNDLYVQLLRVHEVPGLVAKAPKMKQDDKDALIDGLMQRLMAMTQEMQNAQAAAQAGAGLEQAGPQPAVPGTVGM
jgi:hypothetical protein